MRSARMVTADYICITVRGGAPWGFSLQGGGGDLHEPLRVSRVDKGGHAALAGLCEGDEVVSLNGRTCSDLTLADAMALMDSATDRLSLLVKRYQASDPLGPDGDQRHFGVQEPVEEGLESTTLQIWPRRELYISESQDEAYYGESESDPEISAKAPPAPASAGSRFVAPCPGGPQGPFTTGALVELQLSLADHTLEERDRAGGGGTALGDGRAGTAVTVTTEVAPRDPETRLRSAPTTSPCISSTLHIPISSREPLGQRGEVEVTLRGFGRGRRREEEGEEVRPRGCVDPQAAPPAQVSFSVSSSEGAETADQPDTESEGDPSKPSKHRARHARFRRSESLSEKQVKEAKSKCKRIALLLTAAPNPNSKGVLMFKRRRQRAKKYTLVSYGTGETEPEESDEEDEAQEFEFTLLDATESGLDEDFLAHAQRRGHILTLDWDTGLLEIEKKLDGGEDMECLPDTKGKGALMFAKRRQRVDEITAEHEEMRRKGLPVEAMVPEAEAPQVSKQMSYQVEEHTYVQSPGGQVYMDLNVQQQQQQQQQQQYQEYQQQQQLYEQQRAYQQQQYQQQQHYEQQQHYQQQQHYEQQQHYQQQHYEQQQQHQQQQQYQQQHYQQQHHYEQQQHYQQQQQQQQYSHTMNGIVSHQIDAQRSAAPNVTAKPYSGVQNRVPAPFLPSQSHAQAWTPTGSGEQIASRDERISVPAIKTGILQETRRRNASKPMFTFKEAPKVSPNPELLNLLNRQDKKPGFESEEDYLSLGAEACNFLQSTGGKKKVPPPVAPKPSINPASPPWSPQPENSSQATSQQAQYEAAAPAEAPPTEAPPPAPEKPPPTQQQATVSSWSPPEPQAQPLQAEAQSLSQNHEPAHQPVTSWAPAQSESQPQAPVTAWAPAQSESQPQAPVTAWAPVQSESQPQAPVTAWAPVQSESQPQAPVTAWAPAQSESQPQAPVTAWAPAQSESQPQAPVTAWAPAQSESQPQAPVTAWAPAQSESQPQAPVTAWAPAQSESQPQAPMTAWAPAQSESQPQAPMTAWAPAQSESQPQAPVTARAPAQSESQPQAPVTAWTPAQSKSQPQAPVTAWAPVQSESQPQAPVTAWAPAQSESQPQAPVTAWAPAQSESQPQAPMTAWAPAQSESQPQAPVTDWAPAQSESQPQAPVTAWAPAQSESQPQAPVTAWAPAQSESQLSWVSPPQPEQQPKPPPRKQHTWAPSSPPQVQVDTQVQPPWPQSSPTEAQVEAQPRWPSPPQPQSPATAWAPQPNHAPASAMASAQNHVAAHQPAKSQNPPERSAVPPPPPRRINSYTHVSKALSESPAGPGPAFGMPALRGKGAELFAKRQSRMEKYVVDSATVEANRAKAQSPTASLPGSWKYSSNIRAPPPLSYNPIQSPSYPPGAVKPAPSSGPAAKAKGKGKGKGKPVKPLHALDVMKYQPYQLNSSLFTYGPAVETSPKPTPSPVPAPSPAPVSQNQPIRYEKVAAVQPSGPMSAHYPVSSQQPQHPQHPPYGAAPGYQDGPSYQMSANSYQQPPNPVYQPGPSPPYQQVPSPSYQQVPSPAYHQAYNPAYQQAPSPPYPAAPSAPYQPAPNPLPPSSYVVPKFPVPSKAEPAAAGVVLAAPKPKFSAKKSAAQVWKPAAVEQEREDGNSGQPNTHQGSTADGIFVGLGRGYIQSLSRRSEHTVRLSAPGPQPFGGARQVSWLEKGYKPPTPWQAACRSPFGLVDEAFSLRNLQQSIAYTVKTAAQRKALPEPPEEWKARVSYEPPPGNGARFRPPPAFASPSKSTASAPPAPVPRALPLRMQLPQRSVTESSVRYIGTSFVGYGAQPAYRPSYNTGWRW
ncbi:synaptopodin-2 [Anguilla anguilla]|uniref:synaptopodin-2 n=1 Tax=Anguilla anguilla TaxID=7936 RepID=UPI0015B0E7FD|nr:synaptopodin-2 [Anguilla anguilla]